MKRYFIILGLATPVVYAFLVGKEEHDEGGKIFVMLTHHPSTPRVIPVPRLF